MKTYSKPLANLLFLCVSFASNVHAQWGNAPAQGTTSQTINANIGIGTGTVTPTQKLVISGTNSRAWIGSNTTTLPDANTTFPRLLIGSSTASTLPGIISLLANEPTAGTSTALGGINWSNYNIASADKRLGSIGMYLEGGATGAYMNFVTSNAGVYSEKMRITKDGNVGIGTGTVTPQAKLEVNGTFKLKNMLFPANDGTSGQVLSTNGSGTLSWTTLSAGSNPWTLAGSDIYRNTGNVGIGTNAPKSKLDVNGFTRITGDAVAPTAGEGLEFSYNAFGKVGTIQAMDRTSGTGGLGNLMISGGITTVTGTYELNLNNDYGSMGISPNAAGIFTTNYGSLWFDANGAEISTVGSKDITLNAGRKVNMKGWLNLNNTNNSQFISYDGTLGISQNTPGGGSISRFEINNIGNIIIGQYADGIATPKVQISNNSLSANQPHLLLNESAGDWARLTYKSFATGQWSTAASTNANPDFAFYNVWYDPQEDGTGTNLMSIRGNGQVAIGTDNFSGGDNSQYQLLVNGKIKATAIKVKTGWADYVFKENYNLKTLQEVEEFIKKNGHLPDVPSAKEIEAADGVDLAEMNVTLLKKIEELTLYVIEQQKEMKAMKQSMANSKIK